ncbi:MAG: hypothetical protein JWP52_4472, partial [Rhizobacter sp.]|nr:hypothetical protein [Rhizobacter sp.]
MKVLPRGRTDTRSWFSLARMSNRFLIKINPPPVCPN